MPGKQPRKKRSKQNIHGQERGKGLHGQQQRAYPPCSALHSSGGGATTVVENVYHEYHLLRPVLSPAQPPHLSRWKPSENINRGQGRREAIQGQQRAVPLVLRRDELHASGGGVAGVL